MKNITLRQFRIFESVARNLSFSRAAEDLHLTQPAVSMQIKQMEGLAGLPLFLQTGKRIALTDGGRLILRHCQVILADLSAAEQSLADLVTGGVQKLRVGLITSAGSCFPHLLRAFLAERTNIDLDLTVRSRDHLLQLLRCDQLDLAVMLHPPAMRGVVATRFADHPFVLVAASTHPLACERDIAPERLASERLIVREAGTDTRLAADDALLGHGAAPRLMELGCNEAVKQSVIAGMGIGLLAARDVAAEVRTGLLCVLDVPNLAVMQHWHVVHRGERSLPRAARDFRQFLLDEAAARLDRLH